MNAWSTLSKKLKIIFSSVLVVLIIALVAIGVLGMKLYKLEHPKVTLSQTAQIIADVGKVLVLPQNEVPTIATVSDPARLKDQPFFANAQSGDIVLIYNVSKRAVLWRPSTQKVIDVSAVNSPTGQ